MQCTFEIDWIMAESFGQSQLSVLYRKTLVINLWMSVSENRSPLRFSSDSEIGKNSQNIVLTFKDYYYK